MLELLIPERADKYFGALGHGQHLGDGPHEGAVHPHELLMVDLVRLVEDDPHLVLVPVDRLDRAPELVRDVEFVGVEEEDDAIHALGEPLQHPDKVVAPVRPLLFARQYTWKMRLIRLFYIPPFFLFLFQFSMCKHTHAGIYLQESSIQYMHVLN